MERSTVYQVYDHNGCGAIVTVLGHAKDLDKNYRAVQLHYEGNLDDCLRRNDRAYCVHSTLFSPELNERLRNNFYFDRSAAIQAAKEAGVEDAGVWCTHYYYIRNSGEEYAPLEFPVIVQLRRNKKGLYCRLNVHPELDGLSTTGKLFFPDRACASTLCEGPVIIESIEDHGTFGFFIGKMAHFSVPSDEQLAKYIMDYHYGPATIRFMEGKFGSYVAFPSGVCLVAACNGVFDARDFLPAQSAHCTKIGLAEDFACQFYQGTSLLALMSRFVSYDYHGEKCSTYKQVSPVFESAIARFVIDFYRTPSGTEFVEVSKDALRNVMNVMSRDEMRQLVSEVNAINNQANETSAERLRTAKQRGVVRFGGAC